MTTKQKPKTQKKAATSRARAYREAEEAREQAIEQASREIEQEQARVAERVASMTPAKRRSLFSTCKSLYEPTRVTMDAAKFDLLALLIAVGTEFVRTYFPDATSAGLNFSRYENHDKAYHTHIPFASPPLRSKPASKGRSRS